MPEFDGKAFSPFLTVRPDRPSRTLDSERSSARAEEPLPPLEAPWMVPILSQLCEGLRAHGITRMQLTLEYAGAGGACHVDFEQTAVQHGSIDLE